MADFFKYVGKADRGIQDWSKIGKDISDGLKEVTDKRQAERARIDKLTSDTINEVNNVELGQSKTFNQFILNGSGQTKVSVANARKTFEARSCKSPRII